MNYRNIAWALLFNAIVGILLVTPLISEPVLLNGATDVAIVGLASSILVQSVNHYRLRTIQVSSVLFILSAIISWGNIYIVKPMVPSQTNAFGLLQSQETNLVLILGTITTILRLVGIVFAFIEYYKVMKLENHMSYEESR